MKKAGPLFSLMLICCCFLASCRSTSKSISDISQADDHDDFVIAFGSCDDEDRKNHLWDEVLAADPNLWLWGGDIIYADTEDMQEMQQKYNKQLKDSLYLALVKQTEIMGTWDDHDYGVNDGGAEYPMKKEAQQLLLDFLGVSKESKQRNREGVYTSKVFKTTSGSIKVIVLDTRYFRSPLTKSKDPGKRYHPGVGTLLGESQWLWLSEELKSSEASFNIILSSIQMLSGEHGFETWANFPAEQQRFFNLLKTSKAKNVIVLSGDRHISEFSAKAVKDLPLLIDFTSSGLTHAYRDFKGEPNMYRMGYVVPTESFGVLRLNLKTNRVLFQMIGDGNVVLQSHQRFYEK